MNILYVLEMAVKRAKLAGVSTRSKLTQVRFLDGQILIDHVRNVYREKAPEALELGGNYKLQYLLKILRAIKRAYGEPYCTWCPSGRLTLQASSKPGFKVILRG